MKIKEILLYPQTIDTIHESCYRAYHVLSYVTKLVERGCDKETILELIEFLDNYENEK